MVYSVHFKTYGFINHVFAAPSGVETCVDALCPCLDMEVCCMQVRPKNILFKHNDTIVIKLYLPKLILVLTKGLWSAPMKYVCVSQFNPKMICPAFISSP